jgi:hypothetical protein
MRIGKSDNTLAVVTIFRLFNIIYIECGISQLTDGDNECKNEAKAQIVTC